MIASVFSEEQYVGKGLQIEKRLNLRNNLPLISETTLFCELFRFVYLCLEFFVPLEILQTYGYVTISRKGLQILTYAVFSRPLSSKVSLAYRHGSFVYNGHLWGPSTLTPVAERLAVELSLPVFTTQFCLDWDSNTQPSCCGANTLTNCTNITTTAQQYENLLSLLYIHV